MEFICMVCGKIYANTRGIWKCSCGGYIATNHVPEFSRKMIKSERLNMWRYDDAFPLKYEELKATYNEGLTPLVHLNSRIGNIYAKMDSLMPTGSFKDRGTVMVVNQLLKEGVTKITEDSSGNAGASVAGYSALAGIHCEIYVPAGNSKGKLIQIASYGASIHEIEGTREDVAAAAQKDSECYAGHNWHPMFLEGTKSAAYEIWEQMGFRAPENVVAVAGNGSTILGLYYGFKDLLRNGEIDRMPRLFVAQAEKCNPIYRMYKGLELKDKYSSTVAEGIALARPNKSSQVVKAVKETNGEVLSLSEEEIIEATFGVARLGIFAEPTSSTAYAAIKKLLGKGTLGRKDEIVLMVSGNGLKSGIEISELADKE